MTARFFVTPNATSANFGNNVDGSQFGATGVVGQYNAVLPTITTGNVSLLQCTASGILQTYLASALAATTDSVAIGDRVTAANLATVLSLAGLIDNPTLVAALATAGFGYVYDAVGAQWLRMRGSPGGAVIVASDASRNTGTLVRNAITTADVVATPGVTTLTDRSADGGSLVFNTTYWVGVASVTLQPGSTAIIGSSTINVLNSVLTANDANSAHRIRVAFAQVTSADGYLIFLSTGAAPAIVGYITEAQRASGIVLNTPFTTGAGSVAGAVDVGAVGTGILTSNSAFAQTNAHLLPIASVLSTVGYSKAWIHVRCTLSKATAAPWANAPAVTVLPWTRDQEAAPDYFAGAPSVLTLLSAVGSPMEQVIELNVNAAVGLLVTFPAMLGVLSVSCYVELVS